MLSPFECDFCGEIECECMLEQEIEEYYKEMDKKKKKYEAKYKHQTKERIENNRN